MSQTYPVHEVLVVNDGSPDTGQLEQVLQPYAGRITYLKQANAGPSSARNAGIRHASGTHIAFLDSDDSWFPEHLAKHVAKLTANSKLGLVYSDSILVRDRASFGHAFGQQPQHPPVTFEKLLVEDCAIGTSSVVAQRSAILDAGWFDEQFWRCEDFDLWLRMSFKGTQIDFCREPTLYHRSSPEGLSADRYQMKCALIDVYRKIESTLPVSAEHRSLIHRCIKKAQAGTYLDLLKQHLAAHEYGPALKAAEQACTFDQNGKVRLAIVGLKRAPRLFAQWYQAYEGWLRLRNRWRQKRFMRMSIAF